MKDFDDHLGPRWEEAFRMHLRRTADLGQLGPEVVAVGPFWTSAGDPNEIDAVVLAGRRREAVMVGEAKWAKRVDASPLVRALERKSESLPMVANRLRYAICGREEVTNYDEVLAVTAADIFP